jgi:transcription elongation GreA/GreB family factor
MTQHTGPRATATDVRVPLTREGRALLEERLAMMRGVSLPLLRPLLTAPDRDERDVAQFERLTAESDRLDALLAVAVDVPPAPDGVVGLGSRVLVELPDGPRVWLRPVHPAEAFLDEERVSCEAPVARAVLGARAGDDLVVGAGRCRVVQVESYDVCAEVLGAPA